MTKLPVLQLIDLQAYHLDLSARFEQIDEILLLRIDGDVTNPQRVPIRRLDALWTVSAAAGGLCLPTGIRGHLVHVGKIQLDSLSLELLSMLLHCLIDAVRVLKLNVCEIAPDVPLTAAYLGDCAAILEELNQLCLLGLLVCPSDPDRAAALGFGATLRFLPSPRCRRSPVITAPIILTAAARLPSPY